MTKILICTVGGSYQPIVSAINDAGPDFVLFVCTDKDPATGRAGSLSEIIGKGNIIKAQRDDIKPSLPNIPAQTGLIVDAVANIADDARDYSREMDVEDTPRYQYLLTQSDDLDSIYHACKQAIDKLKRRFPSASLYADYTGGTKSMSVGLVMAALEHQDVALQLVTGSRADLIRVQDGSQFTAEAASEKIRFHRLIAPYRQAWTRFAYSEAAAGLKKVKAPSQPEMRGYYARFHDLSRAFAEWDNFNHAQALAILQPFAPNLSDDYRTYIGLVQRLNDQNIAKRTAAQLFDLYRNAERRAEQGRYDDAIARIYRLLEWSAQWILDTQCGIKTADIQLGQIPDGMALKANRDGKIQVGLFEAWQLVKCKTQGRAAWFIQAQENILLNHTKLRNASILAHGFKPLQEAQWKIIHTWLVAEFIPMLLVESANVGIKELPPQLPNVYER